MSGLERAHRDEFVTARWAELYRLALLVTDDPSAAERLTTSAFAALLDGWEEANATGHPSALVRGHVLREALGQPPGRTTLAAPEAAAPVPDAGQHHPAHSTDLDIDVLLARWSSLTPTQRAAVALVDLDRFPSQHAADELGMPRATVEATRIAAWRVLSPDTDDRGTSDPATMLQVALEDRLARAVPAGSPAEQLAAHRRHRRRVRRRRLAASGLITALAALGVALWASDRTPPPPSSVPATTRPEPVSEIGSWNRLAAWPARGSLARDPHLATDVATRYTGAYRILWADEVDGRRYVLLVSRPDRWFGLVLLSGAAGAPLADLAPQPVRSVAPDERVVALLGPPGQTPRPLVVLTTPDQHTMQVSMFVTIDGHNAISRSWETRPISNGIGIRQVATGTYPALLVRAAGQSVTPINEPASWSGLPPGPCGGCQVPDEVAPLVGGVRVDAAAATGTPITEIRPELLFLGAVATGAADHSSLKPRAGTGTTTDPPERTDRAVSFLLRLPSGATVRTTYTAPAGTPWTQVPPAMPVELNAPVDPAHPYDAPLLIPVVDLQGELKGFELVLARQTTIRRAQLVRSGLSRTPPAVPAGPGTTWLPVPSVEYTVGTLRTWDAAGHRLPDHPLAASPWTGPWDVLAGAPRNAGP